MSSYIGYVICLVDTTNKANIINWSLIICKWVTRSVLAAKLYGMANEFDIRIMIKATLEKIFGSIIPLILYTNSKSLYDFLIKLDTI